MADSTPPNDIIQETMLSTATNSSASNPVGPLNDAESTLGLSNSNAPAFRRIYGSAAAAAAAVSSISDASPNRSPPSTTRLLAPDLLRGLLMAFMALDHNVMTVRSWPHGVNPTGEADGNVVRRWNRPIAIFARELSHNCAPGFILLLGMGIVLLAQSRRRKGWPTPKLAKHIAMRAVVLTAVQLIFGLFLSQGTLRVVNTVLLAISVDYFLAGMLTLGIEEAEAAVARWLDRSCAKDNVVGLHDNEEASLLPGRLTAPGANDGKAPARSAANAAHHLGNFVLFALATVTLWWNQWLSPYHGHCPSPSDEVASSGLPPPTDSEPADFWRFWFHGLARKHVLSGFPPLAWLAPAILGLLYARIVYLRPQPLSKYRLASVDAGLGLFFAILFVSTRLLHVGNLTEDCIRIDGETLRPGQNQYLQSAVAFLYVAKYPPDAAFYFYTLSANFLLLAILGLCSPSFSTTWMKPLLVYGQSALFFYVVHFFVLLFWGFALIAMFGHKTDYVDPETGAPADKGLGTFGYFFNWAACLATMYPLCSWYGRFKQTRGPDSLWRFF